MDWYAKYKSPLGYQVGENQIDSYGVDHSGFSVRDELAYQRARQQRENQIIQNFHNQGITQDYPQAGTNFWGNSPDNNFGFGSYDIIENITKKKQNNNSQALDKETNNIPRYWDTAADGKKVWNYVQQQEGKVIPAKQNKLAYGVSGVLAIQNMINNKAQLDPQPYTDKYKHALINCKAAQYGEGGYDAANALSLLKEAKDVVTQQNTLDSSFADNYANKIGRLLGTKYKQEKCETLVPRYINQYYK